MFSDSKSVILGKILITDQLLTKYYGKYFIFYPKLVTVALYIFLFA